MKQYPAKNIRNIVLLGHGGSGKTTLADAILYYGKATDRIGKIADGTTVMDYDPEEKKRKCSINTSVYPIEVDGVKMNIIDAPGQFDFEGGIIEGIAAAGSGLVFVSARSGVFVGTEKCYKIAHKYDKPVFFFVGKLDVAPTGYFPVLADLQARLGDSICPMVVPYVEGEKIVCYIDLLNNKAFTFDGIKAVPYDTVPTNPDIESARNAMREALASADESLMEKFFAGEQFTAEEKIRAMNLGIKNRVVSPVFCGSGQTGEGVSLLVDIMHRMLPGADEVITKAKKGEDIEVIPCDPDGPPVMLVFKTIADPFVGKLSYFKVYSGKVKADMKLKNMRTGKEEKLNKLMWIKGGKQEDADYIGAGDIGCVAKMGDVVSGDTLCAPEFGGSVMMPYYPEASLSLAVYPKNKGDEEKIANGLARLMEEDPTVSFTTNKETREQLLSGLGEQHIDVIVSKLKAKFGVDVELRKPKVPYRETIRKTVEAQGRHKKQSGGHGQFGDVWIRFEPCDCESLEFAEEVFGGSVPKNFFPAVEKGLRESITKGVLAGYPMVGVKATLYDGSYHPVDSSEMSFKLAAALAYKEGIPKANPILLEPIGTLKVTVPDNYMGDVIGDINKRRGRVLGMEPLDGGLQEITADVSMAEMSDFSTAMRQITQGRATFTFEFARYEDCPAQIAEKVIAAAKAEE